jgi:hypothetical protein
VALRKVQGQVDEYDGIAESYLTTSGHGLRINGCDIRQASPARAAALSESCPHAQGAAAPAGPHEK